MKIFTGAQIHELDKFTIEHEPIESIDLMERAARTLTRALQEEWDNTSPVVVFAGPGNNGGDALAMARMLAEKGYDVQAYLFNTTGKLSPDCAVNKERLEEGGQIRAFTEVVHEFDPPVLEEGTIVIDGLFGSGLNKPLTGGFASLVKYINASKATVVSIDVPSGLMTEDNSSNVRASIIHATLTLTLQQPKLSFFFTENQVFIGRLHVLDIGISKEGIENTEAQFMTVEDNMARKMLRPRDPFAHKGSMGHALIIAGSYGMGGAAILAAKACLRAGVGKLTTHIPKCNNAITQISVPESVVQIDSNETCFTNPSDMQIFQALGIGPGLGQSENTAIALNSQLRRTACPIVADADALNILANHRTWIQQLPEGIIMTPHPKEFDRMFGHCSDSYERLQKAIDVADKLNAYILLKGHFSALCMPNRKVIFNSTGNAGMATAGSGDVLTGIITGLLARGYRQAEACVLGMYLHGMAGDLGVADLGMESLIASDLIDYLPKAFLKLQDEE